MRYLAGQANWLLGVAQAIEICSDPERKVKLIKKARSLMENIEGELQDIEHDRHIEQYVKQTRGETSGD